MDTIVQGYFVTCPLKMCPLVVSSATFSFPLSLPLDPWGTMEADREPIAVVDTAKQRVIAASRECAMAAVRWLICWGWIRAGTEYKSQTKHNLTNFTTVSFPIHAHMHTTPGCANDYRL